MSSAALPNGDQADGQHDDFGEFFKTWVTDQDRDLQSLKVAADSPLPRSSEEEAAQDRRLRCLLTAVVSRYELYYRAKDASARCDVLPMFTPTWTSSTENLFLWVGGWRPTMAIHLFYSKCGMQLESSVDELLRGASTQVLALADLDHDQLHRVDQLHRLIVRREKQIVEEEAAAQETVADRPLVRLTHVITEMGGGGSEEMEEEMKGKHEGMRKVLEKADCLRIETLKSLVEILRPMQAVHFLIAAAELHLRVHDFGKLKGSASPKMPDPAPVPPTAES